jgi:phosphohistidine phosphatase
MLTLYLLRHAKSDWSDHSLPDAMRPLSARGRRDAQLLATFLDGAHVHPDLVLCSTATRTRETLEPLIGALGNARVELEEGLYGASAEALLDRLRAVPDPVTSVMLIGHNPGLQELALRLTRPGKRRTALEAKFPTAALATIEPTMTSWRKLVPSSSRLSGYSTPRQRPSGESDDALF